MWIISAPIVSHLSQVFSSQRVAKEIYTINYLSHNINIFHNYFRFINFVSLFHTLFAKDACISLIFPTLCFSMINCENVQYLMLQFATKVSSEAFFTVNIYCLSYYPQKPPSILQLTFSADFHRLFSLTNTVITVVISIIAFHRDNQL